VNVIVPALQTRGVPIVDLRGRLPRNTAWTWLRAWSTRPLAAIQMVAWHYPAAPPRPVGVYDEVARIAAWAREHVSRDWGNGYHAPTLAYAGVIGGSGVFYVCNNLEDVTWHSKDANGIAAGILVDVGEGQWPTSAQLVTMQHVADALTEADELPIDTGDHYNHGELTSFGNATACPGNVRSFVQRYRATGFMEPLPPPPPEEYMHLTDEQIKEHILPVLWGAFPYAPFFGIAQAWVDELRADRYRGAPLTPEVEVPETDIKWQRFERGVVTFKASDASFQWTG
jgi:hypothetical protein